MVINSHTAWTTFCDPALFSHTFSRVKCVVNHFSSLQYYSCQLEVLFSHIVPKVRHVGRKDSGGFIYSVKKIHSTNYVELLK